MTHLIGPLHVGSAKDAEVMRRQKDWFIITVADSSPVVGDEHFPMSDPGNEESDFGNMAKAIELGIERFSSDKQLLIHCIAGVNRSVTICIGILMKVYGYSLSDAHNFISSRRLIGPYRAHLLNLCKYMGISDLDFELEYMKLVENCYYGH
jgi:protein-tyrosine phosphatase